MYGLEQNMCLRSASSRTTSKDHEENMNISIYIVSYNPYGSKCSLRKYLRYDLRGQPYLLRQWPMAL